MHSIQTTRITPAIVPGPIVDDGPFTSSVIDLEDYEGSGYLEFVGVLGSLDATMDQLRVMESDTTADDTTLGGTPTLALDVSDLPAATDDGKPFTFGFDLRNARKRYLQLQATAGNGASGTFLTVLAIGLPSVQSSDAEARGLLFAEYA